MRGLVGALNLVAVVLAGVGGPPAHAQRLESGPGPTIVAQPSEAELKASIDAAYEALRVGPFDEAYAKLRQALLAAARTDHQAFTITSYTNAAVTLYENGLHDEADDIFAEGEQTRAMRADVKERADFYLAYAQFRAAVPKEGTHFVPLFSAATDLYSRYYGKESPELMHANDLLGQALAESGQVGTAINLSQGNYDLALKALGADAPLTWRLANNLAETLRLIGAPSKALTYDKIVLEKRLAHFGKGHLATLTSANNAGLDCLQLGDYAQALHYFALNREMALAMPHDPILLTQADLWILYTKLLAGREKFDDRNVAAIEKIVDDQAFPQLLRFRIVNLLADHFDGAGDHGKANSYLERAYDIAREGRYPNNSLTFAARLALANAKSRTDPAGAAADFAKFDQDLTPWISMQVGFAGSRDVTEATRAMADDLLYDYGRLAEIEPHAVASFADAVRRWPSLEDGKRDGLRKLARLVDPDDTVMHDLISEAMRLSFTYREIFGVDQSEQSAGWPMIERLRAIDEAINRRANETYHITQQAMDAPLPTPPQLLQADQALVQYFITRKWRPDRQSAEPFEDVRLYGFVWRKDKPPQLTYLGDPREIVSQNQTRQLASLRSTRSAQDRGAVPIAIRQTFTGLDEKLIAPLQSDLAGATTLFVVPDGQLFAVPFSLLQDGQTRLLEQRYTVRMLTRPESLYGVTAEQTLAKDGKVLLAGGLDYANASEKGAEPLPGTLKEVREIADILRSRRFEPTILTGKLAAEPVVRQAMEQARIAHLATHGAYASPKTGGAQGVDALWQSDVILSRSGDKRSMQRDDGDGRLYAFELMLWSLSKLELLVLSACETGRGEETFVGGLRGLPTAIGIAGAKRSLLTLWPVDDTGTEQFMVQFYKHLVGGKTYPEALRQTKLDAIGGKLAAAKDPRVWAAFVMFEN
ncbi:MAG: CHAT domain-containing protein [Rhizobiaceae bacterium]